MGFSFDFTGERNVIVYQAEAGMVLDEKIVEKRADGRIHPVV